MQQHYHIAPDYRRQPKGRLYCANCQRTLENGRDYIHVSIDWNLMEVWADNNGKYRIGMNCWKQIQNSPVDEKS